MHTPTHSVGSRFSTRSSTCRYGYYFSSSGWDSIPRSRRTEQPTATVSRPTPCFQITSCNPPSPAPAPGPRRWTTSLVGSSIGLSAGVLASRRQAWLGVPSLSTMPVQYGIYKGKTPNDKKKPPNLMTSYRPVVAESPVTGAEAQAAKSKLDRTLEASALYPPDYFAYRDELRAAELALVCRAACTSSLEVYRSVARCGWDESDTYLRKQSDHIQPLCSRLSPAWNYGEWAAGFYSQLCIRVVSADGLTPGYTPEEGYSQGNPFSANGYQGASVLASSSLPFPKHIRIPPWPSPTALPINRVCYSDDRAFFEPTIAQVSVIAAECVRATLHTNGVPNMDKLEFGYHTLDAEGLPQPAIVEVPGFKTCTLPAPPLIVGIPMFHTLKPADKLSDLLRTFQSVYHSTRDKPMSPLLMVRSFVVFALSRWDFVFSGVLDSPGWHRDLQVYAHKAYRAAFALPPWSCNAFLHLPLHAGGVGCPFLPLRNLSLLAMTYLHASVSRNPLSRASAVYLLDTSAPFSEGMALRTALAALRARVHTHPFLHLHDMRVHAHVTSSHPLLEVLWVVTDGALAEHRVGGGVVFYNPRLGVLRTYSFCVSVVAATSADAEWLAKLVARSLLKGWEGQASFLADATASMHCGFTKAPPPGLHPQPPLQAVGLRHSGGPGVLGESTTRHRTHTHTVALLQQEAHLLAAHGASQALPFTAPLLPLLRGAGHQRRTAPPQCSTQCSSPTRPGPRQRGGTLGGMGHVSVERSGVLDPPPKLHPPQSTSGACLALASAAVSPPPPHHRALLHLRLLRHTRGPPLVPHSPLPPIVSRAHPVGICATPHHDTQAGGVIPA